MTSVASGGTTDRILARIVFKVVRAGSGTPARYSSMLFGASLVFSAASRRAGFVPFTEEQYENFHARENISYRSERSKRRTNRILFQLTLCHHTLSFPSLSSIKDLFVTNREQVWVIDLPVPL